MVGGEGREHRGGRSRGSSESEKISRESDRERDVSVGDRGDESENEVQERVESSSRERKKEERRMMRCNRVGGER